jgi:nicotinate-nucleotide adenylyltransferase
MKIGVLGGTFDPIHYGHLRLAEALREQLELDTVLFVPNQISPLKTDHPPTSGEKRAQMVTQAIAGNPKFAVWLGELEKPGVSYTIETLRALKTLYPDDSLYFLVGMDAVADLEKWREPEAVLSLAQMVAGVRPGTSEADARQRLPDVWERQILFVPTSALDVSSTEIRQLARQDRSLSYLMPPSVVDFIQEHGLYKALSDKNRG